MILKLDCKDCKDSHVHSGSLPMSKRHNYKTKGKRAPKIKSLPYFVDNNDEEHLKRFLFVKLLMIPLA